LTGAAALLECLRAALLECLRLWCLRLRGLPMWGGKRRLWWEYGVRSRRRVGSGCLGRYMRGLAVAAALNLVGGMLPLLLVLLLLRVWVLVHVYLRLVRVLLLVRLVPLLVILEVWRLLLMILGLRRLLFLVLLLM
jgi:hypothetical protein